MTARRGLTTAAIVKAATSVVETEGPGALTLTGVARVVGVKPPSLYGHVSSLDGLRRDVALEATKDLADRLGRAAMGRAGRDALVATAHAFRDYARGHPGLYELTAVARPDDGEFSEASFRAVEPVLAVLRGFSLDERQAVHAARTLRSALHGFVSLENNGGFGLAVDVDDSFAWLVETLVASLELPRVGGAAT